MMKRIIFLLLAILTCSSMIKAQEVRDFKEEQDSILREFSDVKPWYVFGNEKFTLIPMAVLALDVTYYGQDENSFQQLGDQEARYEPGQIRAMRFGILGTLNFRRPWKYIFAGAYRAFDQGFNADSAADFVLYDLRLDIPTGIGVFSFGKMKEPSSLQRVSSMIYLGGFERAMSLDAFLPARNNGLTYTNNFWKDRIYFSTGAFKSFNPSRGIYWKQASNVGLARLAINPFHGWLENHDLHLGAMVRYSDFRTGGSLRQHPEAYFSAKFVETPFITSENLLTNNYELAYRYKNLVLTGEYTTVLLRDPVLGSPRIYGYYIQADYMLTGERRTYVTNNACFSPVRPGKNVQQGGAGALELSLRYSTLYTNALAEAIRAPGSSGDVNKIAVYLTWYPTLLSKLQLGYNYAVLDRFGIVGHNHIYQVRFAILIG